MQRVYARGISPPSDHENGRDCLMPAQPDSTLNQPSEQSPRITGKRSPSRVALQQTMPVSISGSGHFGSARACKRRATEDRSDSLFLSQRRPARACNCAWLSVLYHSRETTVACATRHLTLPTSALPAEAPPSSIPYMYVSRRMPAWNAPYAVCNTPPAAARLLLRRQPQAAIVGFSRIA
jgi:hypothetical protein